MTENAVQQYLERSVPELKALVEVGLFTQEEVRKMVTQRRNFEYAVKAQGVVKSTWLRYIEYEINVDKLRRVRAKRLGVKRVDSQEPASLRRIHGLFYRVTRRFKGDLDLWLQWVQFSKDCGSSNVLSRALGSAVLLFPNVADLWILAADWEFSNDCNMVAARSLMLRAIRSNPTSRQLWLEYFRLELMYVRKIRTRIDLVVPKKKKEVVDLDEEEEDERSDDRLMFEQQQQQQQQPAEPIMADAASSIPISDSSFMKGAIPAAVFRKATETFPDDLEFWCKFVTIAGTLEAPTELMETLRETLFTRFSSSLEYWKFRSSSPSQDDLRLAKTHLSKQAWWEYQVFACGVDAAKVAKTCRAASDQHVLSPSMASVWISALLRLEDAATAAAVGQKALETWPQNSQLWFDTLTALLVEAGDEMAASRKSISTHFKTALLRVSADDDSKIRALFLRFLFALPSVKESSVLRAIGPDNVDGALFALEVAPRVWPLEQSATRLREFCAALLDLCPQLAVFERVLALETNEELRHSLFEDCIDRFGTQSASIWIAYARFETERGDLEAAGRLHWKAKKTLVGEHLTEYLETN